MDSNAKVAKATDALRQIRDAQLMISNAGPDIPTSAVRAVAALCARLADETLTEITS